MTLYRSTCPACGHTEEDNSYSTCVQKMYNHLMDRHKEDCLKKALEEATKTIALQATLATIESNPWKGTKK